MASKSDVDAKQAFIAKLLEEGYDSAEVKAEPSDIVATKNGETWYFEIKMTSQSDKYFGAATLTEWEQAFKTPDRYIFVVAKKQSEGVFDFIKYTPEEFMEFSTIPPFKIFFNIDFNNTHKKRNSLSKRKALSLTKERFKQLNALYKAMREENNQDK